MEELARRIVRDKLKREASTFEHLSINRLRQKCRLQVFHQGGFEGRKAVAGGIVEAEPSQKTKGWPAASGWKGCALGVPHHGVPALPCFVGKRSQIANICRQGAAGKLHRWDYPMATEGMIGRQTGQTNSARPCQ
jgi:hypothetical protein